MVPNIYSSFYSCVIHGVEEIAKKNGFYTFTFTTNELEEEESGFFSSKIARICDGVIAIPSHNNTKTYNAFDKPIVFVDRYVKDTEINGVIIDNLGGMYILAQHLIDYGHNKIALISGHTNMNVGSDRLEGYKQALTYNGIFLEDRYCFFGDWSIATGYNAMKEIVKMSNPPTAVIAGNCFICEGVIKFLNELGIPIGDRFSLVGFDDNSIAQFVKPRVTVISRPDIEMGNIAVKKLINLIDNENILNNDFEIKKLPVKIIKRESVRRM